MLFLTAALIVAITPGPGFFCVAACTLAGGRSEGLASSLGTSLGSLVHVFAGAAGLSALVMASTQVFDLLKFVGAFYLFWLGFTARHGGRPKPLKPKELRHRDRIRRFGKASR
jgi:threonine/homoserine/homoserine lactone efflux protein